ncbi:hypothetical protein M121_4568 [Bacteroides fragilis str. 3783N2-1]|nr:hypothetical protein M121_4568 [Bacteroides fragilis str. 3783N2-1]
MFIGWSEAVFICHIPNQKEYGSDLQRVFLINEKIQSFLYLFSVVMR